MLSQLDDLDAAFVAGVLPHTTRVHTINMAGNRITDPVMGTLVAILPETSISEINIAGGAYDACKCDTALAEVMEVWVAKAAAAGREAAITYGARPAIRYTGAMFGRGDHPAEERDRREKQAGLMSSAGEELVGWAIEVGGRIGIVKEYVGFRLFAKSDFHIVDFGKVSGAREGV